MSASTDTAVVELVLTVGDREFRQRLGEDSGVLKKFGGDAKQAGGDVVSFTGKLGALRGMIAATGAAYAAANLAGYILDTASSLETLNAQLLTSEKTQLRASLAFERIREFAARTPYEIDEVTQAYINLRNLGLDPSIRALTAYGNMAGAQSKTLDQAIQAVADAATGEFERLKEFGIRASQQGEQVTFTFQGISTTVKKTSTEIEQYLQNIGLVNFAGGMERQAETAKGINSALGDSFQALANRIDGRLGISSVVKSLKSSITELVNELAGVPRSIEAINAELDRLAARDPKSKKIGELEGERLDARLRSTDPAEVQKGIDELDRMIEQRRKRISEFEAQQKKLAEMGLGWTGNMLGTGGVRFDEKQARSELSDVEFRRAVAAGRRKNLETAASADAAERQRVADGIAAEAKRKADEEESKARAKLEAAEARAASVEAERNRDAIRDQMARNEGAQLELDTGKRLTTEQNRLLELKYKDADVSKTSLEAELQKGDALQRQVDAAEKLRREQERSIGEAERLAGSINRRDDFDGDLRRAARDWDRNAVDEAVRSATGDEYDRFNKEQDKLDEGSAAAIARGDLDALLEIQEAKERSAELHQQRLTDIEKAGADARRDIQRDQLTTASDFFGNLATIAQAFGKKGFAAYKAFAIAQTVISTYQAAQDAFTSLAKIPVVGPVLGGVAAAAAVAQGLMRVQQIRSMEPGRQFGGPLTGMHPFMEGGEPELIKTKNGKFFVGVPGGGVVSPARQAAASPAGGMPQVVINGAPPGLTASAVSYQAGVVTVDMLDAVMELAAARGEQRTAAGIATGRGAGYRAIQSSFSVPGRPKRSGA